MLAVVGLISELSEFFVEPVSNINDVVWLVLLRCERFDNKHVCCCRTFYEW